MPDRILAVDGDPAARKLLVAALTTLPDLVVLAVDSPASALALAPWDFKLLITEINFPCGSGPALLSELRQRNIAVPALVLSSSYSEKSFATVLASGAADFLQKPVDLHVLRESVTALLAEHVSGAPLDVRSLAGGTFVEFTAPSDQRFASRFQRFMDRLVSTSLSPEERRNLQLALEELLQNAMEWGNQFDTTKTLQLGYCILPDRVTFRIADQGPGFDPLGVPDPSADPQRHFEARRALGKRVGGWGIFLARKLVDEVRFNPKGNAVFLTKYLKRQRTDSKEQAHG